MFEIEDGYRYTLWVTNLPEATRGWRGNPAYIDAAHRVHARVEDGILPNRQGHRDRPVPVRGDGDEQGVAGRGADRRHTGRGTVWWHSASAFRGGCGRPTCK